MYKKRYLGRKEAKDKMKMIHFNNNKKSNNINFSFTAQNKKYSFKKGCSMGSRELILVNIPHDSKTVCYSEVVF